jgi:hypothetical protein
LQRSITQRVSVSCEAVVATPLARPPFQRSSSTGESRDDILMQHPHQMPRSVVGFGEQLPPARPGLGDQLLVLVSVIQLPHRSSSPAAAP